MNGLVYFDQFSLISLLHLSLVISGIFVLLGGVWVVTIQSGGGSVNARWKTDRLDDELSAAVSNERDMEGGSLGHSGVENMDGNGVINLPAGNPINSPPMDPESLSGSSHIPSTSEDHIERGFTQPSSPEHQHTVPGRNMATFLPPSLGILHARRSTVHALHKPSYSQHPPYHTPSFNHTHASYAQVSAPLTPFGTASTLGAGFQIGLSPVSPGFAIVPRERRQRSGELGLGVRPELVDVVNEVTQARRELQRRRTVSEGDAQRRVSVSDCSQNGSDHEDEIGPDQVDRGVDDTQTSTIRDKGKARQHRLRWQWLRKIFRGHHLN